MQLHLGSQGIINFRRIGCFEGVINGGLQMRIVNDAAAVDMSLRIMRKCSIDNHNVAEPLLHRLLR